MIKQLEKMSIAIKLKFKEEKGEAMGDSFITMIAIFLVAVLMFLFPLLSVSERADDVSQLSVQSLVSEFVNNVRSTGKLKMDDYAKLKSSLAATGNTYETEIELQILDENVGVKTSQADLTKIGENQYYTKYTTQVLQELGYNESGTSSAEGYDIPLKEGDIISVRVKNTNTTMAQIIRNFLYRVTGNSDGYILGEGTAVIGVTSNN